MEAQNCIRTAEQKNKTDSIKRLIRQKSFSQPQHPELGIRIVDVVGIQMQIELLSRLGEPIDEFNHFITSLLLTQCAELRRIRKSDDDPSRVQLIDTLLSEVTEYLWPTKN